MGYPLLLSIRYMNSKKGAFISVGTAFAIIGVALGVAALATVMSVTSGFQKEFRDKVLGVNAHVLVMKYSTDFREYRDIMEKVSNVPGVVGVDPFIINPMMVSHGNKTATGVLVKGVDPERMPKVLTLPRDIRAGSLLGLRRAGASPAANPARGPNLPVPPTIASAASSALPNGAANRSAALRSAMEAAMEERRNEAESVSPPPKRAQKPKAKGPKARSDCPLGSEPPTGSAVPAGGYKSELPERDVLPDDVVPDPCASREAVERMPGVVVGVTLAKDLGVTVGDCLQITSPTIGYTFSQGTIRPPVAKQFRVIATFEAGFAQYDSKLVYTDLFEAQAFYDQGDSVMGVELKIADIDDARGVAKAIDKLLANAVYYTLDWERLNHGLFTALKIQKFSMSMVLFLIILVAAFTVVATLIMIVLEKKKEIAVLKAMGASSDAILRTFLYQGGFIGSLGTSAGLALGFGVCKGLLAYAFPLDPKVYFISRLPVEVSVQDFIITGASAVVICLFATVLPALYAAMLRPADGLRAQ